MSSGISTTASHHLNMLISTQSSLFHRVLVAGAALTLAVLAGCGDDDADALEQDAGDDASESPDEPDTEAPDTDDAPTAGAVGATVTIDGTTYEATEEQACTAFGGGIGAAFTNAEGTVTISVALVPDETEPSTVRVDDESSDDVVQWESGGETVDSSEFATVAVVGDHSVDDRAGSGSATFIDSTELVAGTATPVEGTFEVQCEAL